jgi:hypothetical protein
MSTFRQYGGINYAATNNIVRNNISNSNNLGISNILGLPNTNIIVESTLLDANGNPISGGGGSPFGDTIINGTLDVTGTTTFATDIYVNGLTIGRGNQSVTENTALGISALENCGLSGQNSAVGYEALKSNTSGSSNTATGFTALTNNVTGNNNTAFGSRALTTNINGDDNTAFGYQTLRLTTGACNTAIGFTAGQTNTNGYNNTFIGFQTSSSAGGLNNSTALGNGATITASNQIVLGNSSVTSVTTTASVTAASFNSSSDYRIKENVNLLDETFNVDNLRPVTYYNTSINKQDIGFIAHEVQEFFPFLVNGEKDGETNQTLNYNGLIGLLVKEIQDLKQQVNNLKTENQNFKHVISEILPRIK